MGNIKVVKSMPITIRWFDDTKRINLWEFVGQWTLDELHSIYSESHRMCLEVPDRTVCALVDMTGSHFNGVPANIFTALTARKRTNAPNFDMAVIVSNSALIKVFVGTMSKMPSLQNQFAIFSSKADALGFIQQRQAG